MLEDVSSAVANEWIDAIRDRIIFEASAAELQPRDYAATLVALIANEKHAVILHIGDGAAVVRISETLEWLVPSWPYHGEYASTTRFVSDDPRALCEIVHIDSSIDRFAIFSDGIEYLVLDHQARTAPAEFFQRLLQPVATWEGTGRSRQLSRYLREYLDSETVCDATDDDKSLILGARM
jgi:hypothetical protein